MRAIGLDPFLFPNGEGVFCPKKGDGVYTDYRRHLFVPKGDRGLHFFLEAVSSIDGDLSIFSRHGYGRQEREWERIRGEGHSDANLEEKESLTKKRCRKENIFQNIILSRTMR